MERAMPDGVDSAPEIRVTERKVYRIARREEILCRITDLVTPHRDGFKKVFLLSIEELE
jgi:hypothetical protein